MSAGIVLFDDDCGFCRRVAGLVRRGPFDVDIASLQGVDLAALGVDAGRARRDMPYVAADGHVTYGHHAWAAVLSAGPPPLPLLGRALAAPLVDRPASALYRWVAEHRHRLPGGSPTCRLDTPRG